MTSPGGVSLSRKAEAASDTFLVVGELPYHELIRSKDPDRASELENTMQQYLGEAVYLFDGTVLDSLGPDMVASMPDGASAIKAAQKGLADLVEHNLTHADDPVEARMLVHYGELVASTGKPEGAGLTTAMSVLEAMEPLQLLVSRPVIDRVDVVGEPVSIGRLANIDFFLPPELKEPETAAQVVPDATGPSAEGVAPPQGAAAAQPKQKAASGKKGLPVVPIAIAALLVIVLGAAGAFFMMKDRGVEESPTAVVQNPRPTPPTPAVVEIDPNKIFFAPFAFDVPGETFTDGTGDNATDFPVTEEVPMEPTSTDSGDDDAPAIISPIVDPELRQAADALHAVVERIIALDTNLEMLSTATEDSRTIGGRISRGEEGIVLTPLVLDGESVVEGEDLLLADAGENALTYVRRIWPALGRDLSFIPSDDAVVANYLEALSLRDDADLRKAFSTIQKVNEAQPDFVAGLKLRMSLQLLLEKPEDAIETAKRIAVLDQEDAAIRLQLADWEFDRGNPGYGLVWLGELLEVEPDNADLLTRIGQYSLAVGNEEKFKAALARLRTLDVENPRLSEGDIILARGRLDAAAKKYYEDLPTQPDNPILALKIGRLAVLRRSDAVIRSEMERLERVQAPFELAMLRAYISANMGDADTAALELREAELVASPLDPLFTASAEVYLLLNRQDQVLEALGKAVDRAEPTHEYILSNPLFGYLSNDPRFRSVLQKIGEQRSRITAALDTIEL